MSNMMKPSLSMLPVDDIVNELRSNKANRNFMTKEDKATDVEFVAGVKANLIAQAVSADKRDTVNNAMNLNGQPADNYLSKDEGNKILGISNSMTEIFSTEIKNARDEYYQTKVELTKKGFIDDVIEMEGYTDAFKRSNPKYVSYVCGIDKAIVGNTGELFIADLSKKSYFEAGKKFVIKRADLEREIVVTSTGISGSGKVEFTPTVNILDSIDAVELHKSAGQYVADSFSFSEIKRDVTDPQKERYHMQSDDTRTAYQLINKTNTGYAVAFKVPNNAAGALTKFGITAKSEGTPGSILCHVLKKNAIYNAEGNFRCDFSNLEDAKEKGYWIATSQPIKPTEAQHEQEVFFNFFNLTTNKYPVLEGDKYVFIIECIAATEQDYWKIRFSYYENGNEQVDDLQRYNSSFYFEEIDNTGITNNREPVSVINDIDKYDLLFTLATRELIKEDEMGKQEGVYTAHIVLPKPIEVSRARLTTRINREGCYYLESHDSNYRIFTLGKETSTSHSVNDNRFKEDDIVIIGNQFAKIKRSSGNQIETKDPVYIDSRILQFYTRNKFNPETKIYEKVTKLPVYRMNYKVEIKPSLIDWNTWNSVENRFTTTDIFEAPQKMEFKNIIPDGKKSNTRISDRLVFEGDFGEDTEGVAKVANEFELQINWKSPFAYNEINDFKDLNDNDFKELIGRLHDIILTFDKTY